MSFTLGEERRLRVLANRVLRRIFGPKRDEVAREWGKLHNEVLKTLRTGDAVLRFLHGETRYICKFSLVPLHKGECFQRYHTLKHY